MEKTIVKVQISIFSSSEVQSVLIYDENKRYVQQGPIQKELKKKMKGEFKKFFYSIMDQKTKNLTLLDEAPWQSW